MLSYDFDDILLYRERVLFLCNVLPNLPNGVDLGGLTAEMSREKPRIVFIPIHLRPTKNLRMGSIRQVGQGGDRSFGMIHR